jgi:hypothetical protein
MQQTGSIVPRTTRRHSASSELVVHEIQSESTRVLMRGTVQWC